MIDLKNLFKSKKRKEKQRLKEKLYEECDRNHEEFLKAIEVDDYEKYTRLSHRNIEILFRELPNLFYS